jgi:hypothetical protein
VGSMIRMDLLRSVRSPNTRVAFVVIVGLSFLGFHQYVSLDLAAMGGGAGWLAFAQAVSHVGVLAPLIGAIAFGDRVPTDARTGYLALTLMRVRPSTLVAARLLTSTMGTIAIVVMGLLPVFIVSLVAFPWNRVPFTGALASYGGPDWVLTVANLSVLCLASAAWTVCTAFPVSAIVRHPYWAMAIPVALYLFAGLLAPPRFNPIVRIDLLNYVPAVGPLWSDGVVWAGWALLCLILGTALWRYRGDWIG